MNLKIILPALGLFVFCGGTSSAAEDPGRDYDASKYISNKSGPSTSYIFDAHGKPVVREIESKKDKEKAKTKKKAERKKISRQPGKRRPTASSGKKSRSKSSRGKKRAPAAAEDSEEQSAGEGSGAGFSDGAVKMGDEAKPEISSGSDGDVRPEVPGEPGAGEGHSGDIIPEGDGPAED